MLLVLTMLVFAGVSWLNGGPLGNVGAWFAAVLAIGWPAPAGRASRLSARERP